MTLSIEGVYLSWESGLVLKQSVVPVTSVEGSYPVRAERVAKSVKLAHQYLHCNLAMASVSSWHSSLVYPGKQKDPFCHMEGSRRGTCFLIPCHRQEELPPRRTQLFSGRFSVACSELPEMAWVACLCPYFDLPSGTSSFWHVLVVSCSLRLLLFQDFHPSSTESSTFLN